MLPPMSQIAIAAALGASLLSVAVPAQGQAPAQTQPAKPAAEPAQMFGKWALRCTVAETGARSCLLSQTFIHGETKRQVLRLIVLHKRADNTDALLMVAPLGSDLTRHPSFAVPGVPTASPAYRFCARDGCYAEFTITPQLLAEMQKGGQGQGTFSIIRAQSPVALTVSFEGFAEGYAALLAAQ